MMAPEIIKENNRTIALFMFAIEEYNTSMKSNTFVFEAGTPYREIYKPVDLEYEFSWDFLMPVVEYIESLKDEYHGRFAVYICSNNCTIQSTRFRPDKPLPNPPHYFYDHHGESKIEATYYAVVSFIKWWNKYNN